MNSNERPPFIAHWRNIEGPDEPHHSRRDERMSIGAAFGRAFSLSKLGIHHERLPVGRRTSLPHAESAEEVVFEDIPTCGSMAICIGSHLATAWGSRLAPA